MIQRDFADQAAECLRSDPEVLGLAAGGSWISDELDDYSDLDLVLVTRERISGDRARMLDYAHRLGELLQSFTGEHVGEPRLLICLYDNPLLHVDIKFVTLPEFAHRVEDPFLLLDKEGKLAEVMASTQAVFPQPSFQWLEDRFWVWVHYTLTKIGRGEYLEGIDGLTFVRSTVLGPLLHLSHGRLPRGMRRMEFVLTEAELASLCRSVPGRCERGVLLETLSATVELYRALRDRVYPSSVERRGRTEQRVMQYMDEINSLPRD